MPVNQKAFLCLPLKRGLIVWGCFKVFVSFVIMTGVCRILQDAHKMSQSKEESFRVVSSIIIFICLVGIVAALDVFMSILLVVACRKSNAKALKIFYSYCKFMVGITLAWAIYYICMTVLEMFTVNYQYMSAVFFISEMNDVLNYFAVAALHYYILLLVRNQINEFECQYAFPEKPTDPECTLNVKDSNVYRGTEAIKTLGEFDEPTKVQ